MVREEIEDVGAAGPPSGPGIRLIGPILLAHATDSLKRQRLRPIVTGEERWCQLLSEPGSGSDLASVSTVATWSGGTWHVTGKKVWVSNAHRAHYGMLLARTDESTAKHRGLTCFALPLRQPGVSIDPIYQMNGYASFYKVTLDDALVDMGNVIGEVGGGWCVMQTALIQERTARPSELAAPEASGSGRAAREAAAEATEENADYRWYPQRMGRPDLLVETARAYGVDRDPVVRQRIAEVLSLEAIEDWTRMRVAASGQQFGSVAKLIRTVTARKSSSIFGSILGPRGTLMPHTSDRTSEALGVEVILSVPAVSIGGGTDEMQRNLIAERMLGLPREGS